MAAGWDVMALSKAYPLEILAQEKDSVAEIRISGVIDGWQVSSARFRASVDELIAKGIKDVNIYMNGPGGSVFEANEIANEIRRFEGNKAGHGGALISSAYSYLALACDTFEMAENGQYMYHKPHGMLGGNEDQIESNLQLLKNLTKQYRKAYSDKTGMSEDEIESRWSKGDVWLSAQEAKEQGFITAVANKPAKVTEAQKALFTVCGAPKIPDVNSNTDMKNRNQIIAALKLSADATDEQIEAAVIKAQEKADESAANAQAKEDANKIKAEAVVDAALAQKKIKADERQTWVDLAVANYDGTKKILEGMPAPSKASDNITPGASAATGRENWTLADYLDKDPKALTDLEKNDPDKFVALNEAYYGIKL